MQLIKQAGLPICSHATTIRIGSVSNWALIGPVSLPVPAMGQKVRIEWRFVGNGDGSYNGIYIDNVTVTVP